MNLVATLQDAAQGRKVKVLGKGYNPTITSSELAFSKTNPVPAGTQFVMLSVTTAAVAFTFDGTAAVADQGLTLPVGVHTLLWGEAMLNAAKAISATGKFQVVYCAWDK